MKFFKPWMFACIEDLFQGPLCNGLHKQPFIWTVFSYTQGSFQEGFLLHARFLPFLILRVMRHQCGEPSCSSSFWRFYFFPSFVPQDQPFPLLKLLFFLHLFIEQPLHIRGLNYSICSIGTLVSYSWRFLTFACSAGMSFPILKVSFMHLYNAIGLCLSSTTLLIQDLWRFSFYFPSFAVHAVSPSIEGQSVLSTM